ncbi:MAG: LysM peptidoglycan-binding domain-containing protein [Anaerolineales bacterium]|nr:LysM peptidoglycan-binding domain-containing protein [Anaerolineales bacterium]
MKLRVGIFTLTALPIILVGFILTTRTVSASSGEVQFQQSKLFPTPTPGPDGRIIYIVQEGDDFWTIAAFAGISLEELFALNGIQPGDYAIPGTELFLGTAGPVRPTAEPAAVESPTPTPSSTEPAVSTGEICILLFLDMNGDARLDEGELPLAGGQVSVIDVTGAIAVDATTSDDPEGQCFEGLGAGDYNISAAVPVEFNSTTTMSLPVRLMPGDIKYVQFGAQPSAAVGEQLTDEERSRSTIFGVFGVILLVGAGALSYYVLRYERRSAGKMS